MLQRVLSFRRVTLVQVAVPCRAGQIISLIYDFVISYVCISDFPKTSRSRRILTGNGGGGGTVSLLSEKCSKGESH